MDQKHKFSALALAVLGTASLMFGVYRVYISIYGPFRGGDDIKSVTELTEEQKVADLQYIMALQYRDSDNDKLSDYDERYVYGTSPYMADTDSDGLDDRTELEQGNDPFCHKYEDCTGIEVQPEELPRELEDQIYSYPEIPLITQDEEILGPDTSMNLSADQIRLMLQESGMSQDQVDSFSDEDLLNTWNDVLNSQNTEQAE